jgi:hypothetical protein
MWLSMQSDNYISKCIKLRPDAIDFTTFNFIMTHVNRDNFHEYSLSLSIVLTALPLSFYYEYVYEYCEITKHSHFRRKILNLLPSTLFTLKHDTDYRDLNWQSRAAMIMLLLQIKIQRQSNRSKATMMER